MQRSRVVAAVAVLAVVGWWVIGFLPWLVSGLVVSGGAGSPGSSAEGTSGLVMPLPLVAGSLPELVACGIVGGTLAGLVPIAVTHIPRGVAMLEVWFVVLAGVGIAWVVSASRVRQVAAGLFAADRRVLDGLGLALLASVVLGLLMGTIAVRWHAFTAVAAALVAGTMRTWVAAFVPPGRLGAATVSWIAAVLLALLLGTGLVVSVRRTVAGALAWPVALAVLWATGPALVAVSYLTALLHPSSGLPGSLRAHLDAAGRVFGQAVGHTHPSYVAVAVSLAAGVGAVAVRARIRHREAQAPSGAGCAGTDPGPE